MARTKQTFDIWIRGSDSVRWHCVATNLTDDFSKWEAKNYKRTGVQVARVKSGTTPTKANVD